MANKDIRKALKKPDDVRTIEVKYDGRSRDTGNFFIELEDSRGQPSGHMKSEADLIIVTDKK